MDAAAQLRQLIRREGPVPFDRFVDVALYHPGGGFFASGRGAGRSGRDFITSPHVGSLFGTCVARALDGWWHELDAVDPFLVVEAGAGDGRLARDVQRAAPACAAALRYLLVERSAALRDAARSRLPIEPADEALGAFHHVIGEDHPVPAAGTGPVFATLDDIPAVTFDGVVIANELLDNLPFGVAQWDGTRWQEVLVGADDRGHFNEILIPARDGDAERLSAWCAGLDVEAGARVPIGRGIDEWFRRCSAALRHGVCCAIDYVTPAHELLTRAGAWLRTYRAHGQGVRPLEHPGEQDITAEVMREQLEHAAHAAGFQLQSDTSQADWLRALGIDELADEGRRRWEAGASVGGLDALAGRSAVHEAAALTDPDGLGAHRVLVFTR